jgi:hypothetical protein
MGLEPTTSSLGRRPVYGRMILNSTVLERVTSITPREENGGSGPENGVRGRVVDPEAPSAAACHVPHSRAAILLRSSLAQFTTRSFG